MKMKQTDWKKVREYVDREEERKKAGIRSEEATFTHTGEAYNTLRNLWRTSGLGRWTYVKDRRGGGSGV